MSIIKLGNLPVVEPVPGFKAKFIHSENTTTAFWEIKAGSELPEHSHIHEQVTMLTKGIAEITINGKLQKLQSGDAVIISSNIPHSAKFISDCKITDVFSPVREDFRNITRV